MKQKHKAIYQNAWVSWGKNAQIAMLAEESAELSAAVLQMIRGRESFVEQEIADVLIMIEQMFVMFPGMAKKVNLEKEDKISRLEERLKLYKKERK